MAARRTKKQRHLWLPHHVDAALIRAAEIKERDITRQATIYIRDGLERDGLLPSGDSPAPAVEPRRGRRAGAVAIAALGTTLLAGAPTQAQAAAGPVLVDSKSPPYALYEAMRRRRLLEAA